MIDKIKHYVNKLIFLIEKKTKLSRKLILYVAIGGTGVLLDLMIYSVLANIIFVSDGDVGPIISNTISSSTATVYTFCLNVLFNFKVRDKLFMRFLSFFLVGLVGLAVSNTIIWIFVSNLNWGKNIVKFMTLFVVLVVQYNLNKHISFRSK